MKIRVQRIEDGPARLEFIDPSDGAVFNTIDLDVGEEVTIVATTANSPADIEVGEVTETPSQDSAPAEDAQDTEASTAGAGEAGGETTTPQPGGSGPGGEESTDPDPAAA